MATNTVESSNEGLVDRRLRLCSDALVLCPGVRKFFFGCLQVGGLGSIEDNSSVFLHGQEETQGRSRQEETLHAADTRPVVVVATN